MPAADPAGRDATAPEVEAVAQAFGYTPSMKRMWPEALEKAAAAIAALDRVRADSARGEDQEERCPRCWLTVRVGMHCEDEACPYPRTSAGQVDDDRPSRGEDHEVITTKAGTRCVCGHSVIQHVPECMGFMPDRHGGRSARCGCERMLPVPSPVDDTESESRFVSGMDMNPAEHKPEGPWGGAWRRTLGPKGEGQMVFRIEAELKLAMLREHMAEALDRERCKLMELQSRLDEAEWKSPVDDTVRLREALTTLIEIHHNTITGSKLHRPESQTWQDCSCFTCRTAQAALSVDTGKPEANDER